MRVLLIATTLALGGCSTLTAFDPRGCPRVKQYSGDEQRKLAADLAQSPKSIQGAMVDYGKLRDESRACQGR